MNFPLTFRFKFIALAPQIFVQDASGQTVCYVKQKMFRFREKVAVFTDESQRQLLATIEADRIIDWSARYTIKDAAGNVLGTLGRRGFKSLWRAHYEVFLPGQEGPAYVLREENPFIKMLDGFFDQIPIVGLLTGYMFHPRYAALRNGTEPVFRLIKEAALFEGRFSLVQSAPADAVAETTLTMSFLMMVLLERNRG